MKRKASDFIATCVLPPRPYDLIWWQKLVWTTAFAVMILIATGGNIIVMWIVLGKQFIYLFSFQHGLQPEPDTHTNLKFNRQRTTRLSSINLTQQWSPQ
ncbi:hypothetical protein RUM44_009211 [Polyplax serrata]|uniref:Uncharacterized protein n=1 Tax=Polyplax serrata TaxID=468196 RepID=A0ABR1AS19_POLSC